MMNYDLGPEAHSFIFGSRDSYTDFHLVPVGKQYVANPPIVTKYVTVPGASGQLDLTTALTGSPVFGNREGSWEFYVLNDIKPFEVIKQNIAKYIHGRAMEITLSDDRMWYYYGRLSLNNDGCDINHSKITIDYHLDPFKYQQWATDEKWLWDPFDFDTGVIDYWGKIKVKEYASVTFDWGPMIYIPTITVHSSNGKGMRIRQSRTWEDENGEPQYIQYKEHTFSDGKHKSDWVQFREGTNTLQFFGTGTVKIGARHISL